MCALAMLIIFQYINYQYLVLFSKKQLELNLLDSTLDSTDNSTYSDITTHSTTSVDSQTVIGNIITSI